MAECPSDPDGTGAPIFQVHPSLRCNLSCAHCYSSSSPAQRDQLDPAAIVDAIRDAAANGYGILSISGGEPLLYPQLRDLLEAGRGAGMRTQIVTNGWFLPTRRYTDVSDIIDVLAISADGLAARHNRVRGSDLAFAKLVGGLTFVRERGDRFGLIHTVSDDNWDELFDVAEFAASAGASLFQVHMLEAAGRAECAQSSGTAERVIILGALLKAQYDGRMHVHVDLQHSKFIGEPCARGLPAQSLNILVLEADGTIVPLSYGFDRHFAVCNIKRERLRDAWQPYVDGRYPRFLRLCRDVHRQLGAGPDHSIFNWHEAMAHAARARAA